MLQVTTKQNIPHFWVSLSQTEMERVSFQAHRPPELTVPAVTSAGVNGGITRPRRHLSRSR